MARRLSSQGFSAGWVAYATHDSPLGPLLLAATAAGLARVALEPLEEALEELARRWPHVVHAPARLDRARGELDEYFARRRRRFELRLDLGGVGGFSRRVLRAVAAIPYGQVRSYREVAAAAGHPRAWRAVGRAVGANPLPVVVPCHRVVRSDGRLGGYGGGVERKAFLLHLERAPA